MVVGVKEKIKIGGERDEEVGRVVVTRVPKV